MNDRRYSRVIVFLSLVLVFLITATVLVNGSLNQGEGGSEGSAASDSSLTEDNITSGKDQTDITDKGSDSSDTPSPPEDDIKPMITPETEAQLICPQIFVYDISTDSFVFEKGTDRRIIPASITKLLISLYALEAAPADTVIQPTKEDLALVGKNSSIAYIKAHHKLTLSMLIEGMLLPSGNDAAQTVAAGVARYVSGNDDLKGAEAVAYFMERANEYAKSIGCTDTHFTVPDGNTAEDHYTTAHDLVIIAKKALENEIISTYTSTASEKVRYASGETITWKNTNLLIQPDSEYYRAGVTGLKTGSLTKRFSLISSADIAGRTFIIGVFDAPDNSGRYLDSTKIIDCLIDVLTE